MIFISKKNCEICNWEYSNEEQYCPNCGSKNTDYVESNDLLTKIQQTPNNFYESQIDNEIEKLNEASVGEILGGIKNNIFKKPKQTSVNNVSQPNKNNKIPHDKIKCPQCDTENDLYSRFCGNCGFPLKNLKICPDCGNLEESSSFCDNCGTKLVDIKVCPECNNIMEFDAKFCGNCGHTF